MRQPSEKVMTLGTGFRVGPDGAASPTRLGAERLNRTLQYYHAMGGKITILCAGGYSRLLLRAQEPPVRLREAYVMADYLMNAGSVPHDHIEVEANSTSTVTNFTYSVRDGFIVPADYTADEPLGVVTHPYHMNRAELVASKLDLAIQHIPTDERDNKWHERRLHALYRVALLGAHGVDEVERRERLLANTLNKLRR